MIFVADITTEITHLKDNPKKTKLYIGGGLIYKVEVEFPTGPCGLLYTCCYDGLHSLWPSSEGVWYHSDGTTIAFDDLYLKLQPPHELDIYTYNLDTVYPHWCQWRVGMVSQEVFMARFLPSYEYKYFKEMLDKMALEEQERLEGRLAVPFPWLKT